MRYNNENLQMNKTERMKGFKNECTEMNSDADDIYILIINSVM